MNEFKLIKKEIWGSVEGHSWDMVWVTTGIKTSQSSAIQLDIMRIVSPILIMIRDDTAYKLLWNINHYE